MATYLPDAVSRILLSVYDTTITVHTQLKGHLDILTQRLLIAIIIMNDGDEEYGLISGNDFYEQPTSGG